MNFQQNVATTAAVLGNGSALVAEICKEVLNNQSMKSFLGMALVDGQIVALSQSVFQAELLKKAKA